MGKYPYTGQGTLEDGIPQRLVLETSRGTLVGRFRQQGRKYAVQMFVLYSM
jgi:hypothetical protein